VQLALLVSCRMAGRTSTTAVMGQPVLWDSLETPDRVAKLAPRDERLTGDAGSEGHLTMLWNVSESLAQDKAGLNFTKGHSKRAKHVR
jgi:hypothetical protein